MKKLNLSLIQNTDAKIYSAFVLILLTMLSRYFIEYEIRKSYDFYTPITYLLIIAWFYYSIFFKVRFDEEKNVKIVIKRKLKDYSETGWLFLGIGILTFFSYQTFFIFGKVGVLFSLLLITVTAIGSAVVFAYGISKSNRSDLFMYIGSIGFSVVITLYIYFIPWKYTFCYEFGIKEIGNYFEKHTYEAKYLILLKKVSKNHNSTLKNYSLVADILVSKDFSQFDSDDTETDFKGYSYETSKTLENRYVQIKKVYFNNGGYLIFNNCLIELKGSDFNVCTDQNGREWEIELTNVKIK